MSITLRSILGIDPIPSTKAGAIKWLRRHGIALYKGAPARGGRPLVVRLSDLPAETRAALAAAEHGVESDAADPSRWARFAVATPHARAEAERRHRAILAVENLVEGGASRGAAIDKAAIEHGTSTSSLRRWLGLIDGAERSSWLAALAPNHSRTGRKAEVDEGLLNDFLGFIHHSGPTMPHAEAYRETRRLAVAEGRAWPSYSAVMNRAKELHPQLLMLLKYGPKARKEMIPPITRDRSDTSEALARVSMDGRRIDVMGDWGDGSKPSRPMLLTMCDVATGKVLARHFAKEESEEGYRALVFKAADRWSWFDEVEVDNTRAASARNLTAGAGPRYRWKDDPEFKGILAIMGVKIHRTSPYCGRSKLIERVQLEDATKIDTRPEFKGAHCGPSTSAKPESYTGRGVPIETIIDVYGACTAKRDAEFRGKDGKTADEKFLESYERRPRKLVSEQQRIMLRGKMWLKTPHKKHAALEVLGNWFWSAQSQEALWPYRGKKLRVYGDPDDIRRGIHVQDTNGNVIVSQVPPWITNGYRDVAGARAASQAKKRATESAKKLALHSAEYIRHRYALPPLETPAPELNNTIAPNFSAKPPKSASNGPAQERFTKLLTLDAQRARREEDAATKAALSEHGGVAAPPAQSATRAEARSTRTKTA